MSEEAPRPQGVWGGRHGPGGTISENHKRRRAADEKRKAAEKAKRGVKTGSRA